MSEEVTLVAEPGRTTGSGASGRLRGEGRIPAVVYGRGQDPMIVSVNRRDLRAVLHTEAGLNALINLRVDGGSHLTIVKDLQRHPVRNEVVHLDFLLVDRDQPVAVDVPVHLEGEAMAVIAASGTVEQQLYNLTVEAKPGDIPSALTLDVSGMQVGDALRVGDLVLPPGVATGVDPDEPIAIAQVTRATLEGEEVAGEEGAEAAQPAEGVVESGEQEGHAGETEETAEAAGE